jgi:hypothetical protein
MASVRALSRDIDMAAGLYGTLGEMEWLAQSG